MFFFIISKHYISRFLFNLFVPNNAFQKYYAQRLYAKYRWLIRSYKQNTRLNWDLRQSTRLTA